MKLHSIETAIIDLPVARPHKLAMAVIDRHSQVIVRIRSECGVEGLGEIAIIPHYGEEAPGAIKSMIDDCIAPYLIGHDIRRLESLVMLMDQVIKNNAYAKGGIEMACVDALARSVGVPAYQLFGGKVHVTIPLLWVLGNGVIDKDVAEAEAKLAEGRYKLFLVKIGKGDPRENVERALAIREALGDKARVRVDINQGWDEPTAKWGIAELEAGGIEIIEQPLPAHDIDGMKRLTERFSIPIMADEGVMTAQDAMRIAHHHAADAFSVKVTKHGGLLRTKQVANIAHAAGIRLFGGTMIEGQIGTSAYAHIFSTMPNLTLGAQLFGPHLLTDDIAPATIEFKDHALVVPDGPGFGVTLDTDKLAFYRRR
ncbi:muconate/chloromuconate family cycloisomerase [Achromobacter aloeverae]|uniref:muconate/chloromuconate family cycloisomerase n=1 Tax=Achromobacter aloeverae TaxID=1750518 RepID=UPI001300EFD6|nr:muconate/chloromuconate family cycloisomerase [Achromobacter aloeverae]